MTLAAVRGLFVAMLFSGFGSLAVRLLVAPPGYAERLDRLARVSLLAALAAGLCWLVVQSAVISEATSVAELADALPIVAMDTSFGRLMLLQLAALAVASIAFRRKAGLVCCAAVVLLQAGHGHAAATGSAFSLLFLADAVHVASAAFWLGGLIPLLILVRAAPPRQAAGAARSFARYGRWCVIGVICSAAVQGWTLVGDLPGLFGTAYGWLALAKLVLLCVLLVFAATNRYRLAPALLRHPPEVASRNLVRSIAWQSLVGFATIGAAAVLTGLPPAMHVQPVWPFTDRISLEAVQEDPAFRAEVVEAGVALLGASVLAVAAVFVRRVWAWKLGGVAAVTAWLAVPHLDLLLAEAGPMTFFRSPTGFAAASIVSGTALYPQHCAACHGADGRGHGPADDLTAAHLWMHSDGELFGWLTNGIPAPTGPALLMPGFAATLSEDDRWALIDFIRARNAGLVHAASSTWSPPIQAPAFDMMCGDRQIPLAELRGHVVRVAIGRPSVVTKLDESKSAPCVSDDPAVPGAYAVVSGMPADHIMGTPFLIDGNGWLREAPTNGDDPGRLAPLAAPQSSHHMQM